MKGIKINGEIVRIPNYALNSLRVLEKFKHLKYKILESVGQHDVDLCPMASAFGIRANPNFQELPPEAKRKLNRNGISEKDYEEFIRWYDGSWLEVGISQSEKAMKVFLTKTGVVKNV